MFKKTEVEALLQSLVLFSAAEKENIMVQYAQATEQSIDRLIALLKEAQSKQGEYISKMVAADASFAKNTKTFLRETVSTMQKSQRSTDASRLAEMEKEFE